MVKNLMDLSDRVAVVIGGTSGLGRTIALGLAEAGAAVVSSGRRQDLVDEVTAAISAIGRETLSHSVNVSDRKSIDSLRDAVMQRFGRVDVLVNAAGRIKRTPTKDIAEQEWQDILDTNLTGMLRCCQSFYEPLLASKRGRRVIFDPQPSSGVVEVGDQCQRNRTGSVPDRSQRRAARQHGTGPGAIVAHAHAPLREIGRADWRRPAAGVRCSELHYRPMHHGRRRISCIGRE